ncbi:MAG: preprotein translocase subunit SecG [Candidatus Acidiferrales bacterium]
MPIEAKWAISFLVAGGLVWVGWKYTPILVALHVLVCFVLVIVIMLQSGNAADLAGAFGGAGSQTAFGPRGAATFLSKATTWCAIVFMMTSMTLSVKRTPADVSLGGHSVLEETEKTAPAPGAAKPVAPAPTTTPGQHPPQAPLQAPSGQAPAPSQAPAPTGSQKPGSPHK